jgi:hypothetical protein
MTIACIIRYQIDPFQRDIQEHGSAFQEAAPECWRIRLHQRASLPLGSFWGLRFNATEQSS